MGISNNLTGTPWHVDRFSREEGDPKRHRSRCMFYDKNHPEAYRCEKWGRCRGSAHCSYYREIRRTGKNASTEKPTRLDLYLAKLAAKEKKIATQKKADKTVAQKKADRTATLRKEKTIEKKNSYPVGSRVCHKTFGTGTVRKVMDGYIKIRFDSGKETDLSIEVCTKNNLLVRM